MRVLLDPDTAELVEVVPEAVLGLTPYDYREAKAASMRASLERREAEGEYKKAVKEKGRAEASYRRLRAQAIVEAKVEHGSTLAIQVAAGREDVAQAKEDALVAEGMVYARLERLRLCTEDRHSLNRLIDWSREMAGKDWGDS